MIPLCFLGCISEIDFDLEGQSRIVIDGVISNSPGERSIRVRRTLGFDSLASPVQASGKILRNGEIWKDLTSTQKGILSLPPEALIEADHTYQLEVETEEGKSYVSQEQKVESIYGVDSLSFDIAPTRLRDDDGNVRFSYIVRFFAHLNIPDEGREDLYFKWQFDNIYAFKDWRDSLCYLPDELAQNPATLVQGKDLNPGIARVFLVATELDRNFLVRYNLNTQLNMLDEATFNFYSKAQSLVSNQGTLFDEIPSPIEGNIRQIGGEDDGSLVLGLVEFSLSDTLRLPIRRSDINFQLTDDCDRATCPPFGPCFCEDCGGFWGRETEIPPFYW